MRLDDRAIKGAIGGLAMVAAVAAAAAATMTAWLFGALAAATLCAGAIWAASLELIEADRGRSWRVAAWGALAIGWSLGAVLLLNAPAEQVEFLRYLVSALIAGGAACRAWRWQAGREHALAGTLIALAFAALAVSATWSRAWFGPGDTTAMALCAGCALELFSGGSFWLGEALMGASHWAEPLPMRASAAMHAA